MTNLNQAITDYCQTAAEYHATMDDVRKNLYASYDRDCKRMGITLTETPQGAFRWSAHYEGESRYGWGKTKGDAIADLLERG